MEPLQTWWTTELYPTSDEDNFGVVGNFEVVKAADAQATIAALQARVRELESELGCPTWVCDCCGRVSSMGWINIVNETMDGTDYDMECPNCHTRQIEEDSAADLVKERDEFESQLTQRTAELEAVSNFIGVKYDAESKTWVSGQAPYLSAGTTKQEACIAAVDALRLACATWETKYRDLQAELERVRGLVKTYAAAKIDFDDKRLQEDHHAWRERYNKLVEAEIDRLAQEGS